MSTQATGRNGQIVPRRQTPQLKTWIGLVGAGILALATAPATAASETNDLLNPLPGACSTEPTEARLVEWDLDSHGDMVPGALAVDDRSNSRRSRVWFATRNGETRVYRFSPGYSLKHHYAEAKSWALGALQTGGVRLRHSNDGRFVFVNTNQETPEELVGGLVAVDTRSDTRVFWADRPAAEHLSDVSVDTRGGAYNVFTAALEYADPDAPDGVGVDGGDGVVQRLRPLEPELKSDGTWHVPAEVTRWRIGGGAGSCEDTGLGAPCIPGITVDRRHGHSIYASQPTFVNEDNSMGAIAEIDPRPTDCPDNPYRACVKVRHWPVPEMTHSPRQILVDDTGRLWGIMSSGHLFSLDVERSRGTGTLTRHDPLAGGMEDLFAVAPDGGTIGFTDTNNDKVSVLFPQRVARKVFPKITFVEPITRRLDGIRNPAPAETQMVPPRTARATGVKYTTEGDGTYIETNVSTAMTDDAMSTDTPSQGPTGMAPDGARKTGSFFYGVTFSGGTNRIGHLELPVDPQKETDHRKDDDDYDDDGEDDGYDDDDDNDGHGDDVDDDDDNDCTPDAMDNDHDNDGVENEHDSKSHRENKRTDRGTMAPGEAKGYEMESDANSVLMVAIVEADDLTAPLSIEFVDPNGTVVLSTPPTAGRVVATATPLLPGLYTVRVKNDGFGSVTYKTTLIGKQIWF